MSLPATPEQKIHKNALERARYARNGARARQYQRDRGLELYRERHRLLSELKIKRGCMDCGYREHSAALHFDHRDPATKSFTIAKSLNYGLARLLAEVAKCDVRCANCHAVRSMREGHFGRPRIIDQPAENDAPLYLFGAP